MDLMHMVARATYVAYVESADGKTHDGRAMPPWEELSAEIRRAWRRAAERAIQTAAELEIIP